MAFYVMGQMMNDLVWEKNKIQFPAPKKHFMPVTNI